VCDDKIKVDRVQVGTPHVDSLSEQNSVTMQKRCSWDMTDNQRQRYYAHAISIHFVCISHKLTLTLQHLYIYFISTCFHTSHASS